MTYDLIMTTNIIIQQNGLHLNNRKMLPYILTILKDITVEKTFLLSISKVCALIFQSLAVSFDLIIYFNLIIYNNVKNQYFWTLFSIVLREFTQKQIIS